MLAPVVAVIDVRAKMCPTNIELVPSVAELPTFQNTLHACAPLRRVMELPEEVISVEAVWKTKTAVGSPCASRTSFPELVRVPSAAAYVPATSVLPARSGEASAVGVGAAALLNAATRSVCAIDAAVSAMCFTPDVVTVVLPVKEVPGDIPISAPAVPLITVGPVLVMVSPPRTAYVTVVPLVIVGPAAELLAGASAKVNNKIAEAAKNCPNFLGFILVFIFESILLSFK